MRISLRSLLFSSHAWVILATLLVLVLFYLPHMLSHFEAREESRLNSMISHLAQDLKLQIEQREEILSHVAENELVLNYLDTYRELALAQLLASYQKDLPVLSFIGPDGREEVRVEHGQLREDNRNFASYKFFQDALARPNEVIFADEHALHEQELPDLYLALAKFHYFGDEFAGLLLAGVPYQEMANWVLDLDIQNSIRVIIEDIAGHRLQIDLQEKGITLLADQKLKLPSHSHDEKGWGEQPLDHWHSEAIMGQDSFIRTLCDDREYFLTHSHIERHGISVWGIMPRDERLAGPRELHKTTLLVFGLVCLVSLFISYVLTDRISHPVRRLSAALRDMGKGHYHQIEQPRAVGELKQLVNTFNQMIQDLQLTSVSRDYFNGIVNSMGESLIVIDHQGKIVSMNRATQRMLGYRKGEMVGRPLAEILVLPEDDPVEFVDCLLAGSPCEGFEMEYLTHDGNTVPVMFTVADMTERVDDDEYRVCVAMDITTRKVAETALRRSEEELQKQAVTDPLTQLYNRRGFMKCAQQQLLLAQRRGKPMALFFIDLNNLKGTNDRFGHQAGDTLICDAAELLRRSFRGSDIIGRIGGDEFAALLIDSEDGASMEERIGRQLEEYNQEQHNYYILSFSVGRSVYDPAHEQDLEDLMSEADTLMYQDKERQKAAGLGAYQEICALD